jgi:hypothetical protein
MLKKPNLSYIFKLVEGDTRNALAVVDLEEQIQTKTGDDFFFHLIFLC